MKKEIEEIILKVQKNEITECIVYEKLSKFFKSQKTREILEKLSKEELAHYNFWKKYTNKDVKPDKLKIWFYFLISKIFGLTFGLKLMEMGEIEAKYVYEKVSEYVPIAKKIIKDEDKHEKLLISLINEEFLEYTGSIVLGLNDALVELTGALAGLTFALQNNRLIALAGLITGIAASFSMAASEYLSIKTEKSLKNPSKSAIYTGVAYVFTVLFLVFPYFLFKNIYFSLTLTILNAILVIFIFNFYISVAKELNFRKRFFEMLTISLSVALISFLIGMLMKLFLGIEI
ncbi:MAG: VIT1/CCC1 transporter family protein [Candidatus Aenigmatarchaeota archaeon]